MSPGTAAECCRENVGSAYSFSETWHLLLMLQIAEELSSVKLYRWQHLAMEAVKNEYSAGQKLLLWLTNVTVQQYLANC